MIRTNVEQNCIKELNFSFIIKTNNALRERNSKTLNDGQQR
jgi:hypothetical protein